MLLTTGQYSAKYGINHRTLTRWISKGLVSPAMIVGLGKYSLLEDKPISVVKHQGVKLNKYKL